MGYRRWRIGCDSNACRGGNLKNPDLLQISCGYHFDNEDHDDCDNCGFVNTRRNDRWFFNDKGGVCGSL